MADTLTDTLRGESHGAKIQKPWCRLAVIFIFSVMPAGLFPGQSEWTSMLADAQVFSSQCLRSSDGGQCKEQHLALGAIFQGLMLISLVGFLPAGLVFDDYGGRLTGTLGAVLNAIGYILLLVSVVPYFCYGYRLLALKAFVL